MLILAIAALLPFFTADVLGQNNLIRNPSFENRVPGSSLSKPDNTGQLELCHRWKDVNGPTANTDWFQNDNTGRIHGVNACIRGNWLNLPQIPSDDGDHYAGLHRHQNLVGEGIQQRLPHKLRNKRYTLKFDYFMPCDTNAYRFDLYFGTDADSLSYHALSRTLSSLDAGEWHTYQASFNINQGDANKYDWFIWVFDGDLDAQNPYSPDGSYLFIDNFILHENPITCTDCDPNGLMSWNQQGIRPYMTPDNDGIFDEWCVNNINNVSWYEMWVIARWGPIYYASGSNPTGFENYSVCWDGRTSQGQMVPFMDTYQIILRLGNCGTQITHAYSVFVSHDLAHNVFSVSQNYVPALYGLEQPPTHYKNLHLYGGTYWGTHDWYACDSIFVGAFGEPRVPYFIAGSTANLGFYSTEGTFIDIGSTDFQLGGDIDIVPQSVQCCAALRLADLDLLDSEVDSIDELSMSDDPIDSDEDGIMELIDADDQADGFASNVYPNPVTDVLHLDFHLPTQDFMKATLISASGIAISEVLNLDALDAGDHSYSISVKSIPDGMYFLQLTRNSEMVTMKVVVQR